MKAINQLIKIYRDISNMYSETGNEDLIDIRVGVHKSILTLCSDDSITSKQFTQITKELSKYRNNG